MVDGSPADEWLIDVALVNAGSTNLEIIRPVGGAVGLYQDAVRPTGWPTASCGRTDPPVTACARTEPVERRLITMRRSVEQLGALGPVGRGRLDRDPAAGLVIERVLALLADLAFEINCQVAAALGEAPETPAAAFGAAARAGLIDERLAAALIPPDGPYHVLVQLYLDTEPERVAGVVSAAVAGYREYVRQATAWTSAATGG